MCMSCNTKGLSRKRKIILFSSLGSGIAAVSYVTFTITSNPAISAAVSALLSLAACPAMCVGMGGVMWFVSRFSKKKNNNDNETSTTNHERVEVNQKEVERSCCGNLQQNNNAQNIEYKSNNSSKVAYLNQLRYGQEKIKINNKARTDSIYLLLFR
jgi:hypothetical protein